MLRCWTWRIVHAEVGSDEPRQVECNIRPLWNGVSWASSPQRVVKIVLFGIRPDLIACMCKERSRAVGKAARVDFSFRILRVLPIFTRKKHCDVRWTVGRWYCWFARKRDVQHLEGVCAYGRSNFGCSRNRNTKSSGLRRMEAQSISYVKISLRQVFDDFSPQVLKRERDG